MLELSRYLYLAAAAPFLILGTAHALATPLTKSQRKGLSFREPTLAEAMEGSSVLLTRRTNVWLAWVGFNLSHSLGVLILGAFVVAIGVSPARFARDAVVFQPLAVAAAAAYLLIGLKYWFRTPIAGCALSLSLFAASWALR